MINRIKYFCTAALCGSLAAFSLAIANPEKESSTPPARIFDNIPASWDYYFIGEETIQAHKGEKVKKLCLDTEFQEFRDIYRTVKQKRPVAGIGSSGRFSRVKLLQGGLDFAVINEDDLLVTLPLSGNYLIKTAFCSNSLERAKYLRFSDDSNRSRVNRCFRKRGLLNIQTRRSSGFKACEIIGLYEWNGPVIPEDLKIEFEGEPVELE